MTHLGVVAGLVLLSIAWVALAMGSHLRLRDPPKRPDLPHDVPPHDPAQISAEIDTWPIPGHRNEDR